MTYRATLLALLAAASPAAAQGRARRHSRPPAVFTGPVNIRLRGAERTSSAAAGRAVPAVLPAVIRCLDEARAVDPAQLAGLVRVDVTLHLTTGGRATAVEFDPPLLARGLSACLGSALFTWRQAGLTRPRASVYLSLELRPP